jgi:hypothetical protein
MGKGKFPLSYSRVQCFKQCPAKFEHLYVNKDVVDEGSDATYYGTRVHESLEKYARSGNEGELTNETKQWKGLVDRILAKDGDKHYEFQMAIDPDCVPCDWFSPDVWLRGIADVLVVNGDKATVLDWKTGKVREDFTQMMVFACMVMYHFPEVNEVAGAFIWLKYDQISKAVYTRDALPAMWRQLSTQFDKVQEAVDIGVFPAKTSRLCGWCPAQNICIYR